MIPVFFKVLFCVCAAYLFGCINPAFILGRLRGFDIREMGSGNAGATNAMIVFGRPVGFCIAVADILKATLSWHVAAAAVPDLMFIGPLAAVACSFGHMYPVTMGFRGGKGFACLLGTALAYDPKALAVFLAYAFIVAYVSKYLCVATTSSSLVLPLYYWFRCRFLLGTLILSLPVIPMFIKHRENFARIKAGKEAHFSGLWNKQAEMDRINGSK